MAAANAVCQSSRRENSTMNSWIILGIVAALGIYVLVRSFRRGGNG